MVIKLICIPKKHWDNMSNIVSIGIVEASFDYAQDELHSKQITLKTEYVQDRLHLEQTIPKIKTLQQAKSTQWG
jgi:hypothetical protein